MVFTVYSMDVFAGLKQIQKENIKVDCVITSPPYWGLRDYGVEGQIGLEKHPQKYIDTLVRVFGEVRKVLKPEGSVWLNLGDSYYTKSGSGEIYGNLENETPDVQVKGHRHNIRGTIKDGGWFQPKQKMLIPHRVAIAMQEDGWILRNDVVWHKPSHMPSSVKDRLTNSFEYLFHFVQKRKYYYDLDSIREPHKEETFKRAARGFSPDTKQAGTAARGFGIKGKWTPPESGKNPSDFWSINPEPLKYAHFATFPTKLVRRPLLATCPKEVCKKCGKGRERIIKRQTIECEDCEHWVMKYSSNNPYEGECELESCPYGKFTEDEWLRVADEKGFSKNDRKARVRIALDRKKSSEKKYNGKTIGWSDCGCNAGFEAGTVLDPFVGSGTTLLEAQRQGKNGIGIELNPEYIKLIKKRLLGDEHQKTLVPDVVRIKSGIDG